MLSFAEAPCISTSQPWAHGSVTHTWAGQEAGLNAWDLELDWSLSWPGDCNFELARWLQRSYLLEQQFPYQQGGEQVYLGGWENVRNLKWEKVLECLTECRCPGHERQWWQTHVVKTPSLHPAATTFFLTQPNAEFPRDSAFLGDSLLGQWWEPDPRGVLSQSESSSCESGLMVMVTELVNRKEMLSWGQSWYCGR